MWSGDNVWDEDIPSPEFECGHLILKMMSLILWRNPYNAMLSFRATLSFSLLMQMQALRVTQELLFSPVLDLQLM